MPADESLQRLPQMRDDLDLPETTTNLVVAARVSRDPVEFSVKHVQLHNRLTGDLNSISRGAAQAALGSALLPYNPSYKLDSHEIMYIDLDVNNKC